MRIFLIIISVLFIASYSLWAQEDSRNNMQENSKKHRAVFIISGTDTIPLFQLPQVVVFGQIKFKNDKERQEYSKLVRDVKKTYPYAKMVAESIIETYEYMQSLPDEKAKQKHLEEIQKYMMEKYKPEMKKMTKAQGRILVKLIDRQCRVSSYEIVKALLGSFKAGTYNIFAGLFGNSLKTKYDPKGEDAMIEEIVQQIEQGSVDYYYSLNYYGYKGK